MCGIGGYLGNFESLRLPAMAKRLAHRGPDDEGIYHNTKKKLGLVHRRLAIQDLTQAGHQPMWEQNNQVGIVFNGEIYNFPELKKELEDDGFSFRGHSDTEVILKLYLRDDVKLLSRLNGIYAFAIWDDRKNSLFIARDGLGVKPLYFSEVSEGFIFASEMKALLVYDQVKRHINPKAIAAHLTFLWSPAPDTAMMGVKKLEPGFAIEVKDGSIIRRWRHYDLPYGNQTIFDGSEDEAIELVTDSLRTAVKRQLISDVPIGAFLSGGLDSSSIVALAHEINNGKNIPCFTMGIEGVSESKDGVVDDLPYARRVASHIGVSLDTIWTKSSMVDRLEEMIWNLDEPQADPAALNAMFICELARSKGIKVLLSGAGGDDIFTGYRRHWALNQERYWQGMPQFIRSFAGAISQHLPVSSPRIRRIAKGMRYMGNDANERIASYFFWLDPSQSLNLLHPDLKSQLVNTDVFQALIDSLQCVEKEPERLNKMLYLEAKHFLADHNLNYTDKVSMASGVEVRVPLLDPDLISLATRLPTHMKQRGKEGKWIFKRAMQPYLPNDVIYRPKTGFGLPLRRWLREDLSLVVEDLLSESIINARGIFDYKAVKKLIFDDKNGRIDATYSIFSLICLEMWCRRFIDNKYSENY